MMISASTSTRSRLCARRGGAGVRRASRLCDTIKFLLESPPDERERESLIVASPSSTDPSAPDVSKNASASFR